MGLESPALFMRGALSLSVDVRSRRQMLDETQMSDVRGWMLVETPKRHGFNLTSDIQHLLKSGLQHLTSTNI